MYIFLGIIGLITIFSIAKDYKKAENKKYYLIKTTAIVTTIIISLFLFGPFFIISPVKIGYSSLKSNGIALYYPSSHAKRAKEIFELTKKAAQANEKFYKNPAKNKVLIASSNLDMLRFGVYPQGNGGGTDFGIVIRESRATQNIIAHEMSHQNLARITTLKSSALVFPRWFDEGLASYIGKMDYYKKPIDLKEDLQKGLYKKDITNWKGVTGMLQWIKDAFFYPNPRLIYGQTYLMVKYLFDTYGEEKVYMLTTASNKAPFNEAFRQTFGISVGAFHQQFIEYIEST